MVRVVQCTGSLRDTGVCECYKVRCDEWGGRWRRLVDWSVICAKCHGATPVVYFLTRCRRVLIPIPLYQAPPADTLSIEEYKCILAERAVGIR